MLCLLNHRHLTTCRLSRRRLKAHCHSSRYRLTTHRLPRRRRLKMPRQPSSCLRLPRLLPRRQLRCRPRVRRPPTCLQSFLLPQTVYCDPFLNCRQIPLMRKRPRPVLLLQILCQAPSSLPPLRNGKGGLPKSTAFIRLLWRCATAASPPPCHRRPRLDQPGLHLEWLEPLYCCLVCGDECAFILHYASICLCMMSVLRASSCFRCPPRRRRHPRARASQHRHRWPRVFRFSVAAATAGRAPFVSTV